MKYRTLAVLAFAGVLAVSGTAFAKADDPNDPFKKDPFGEMQRVRNQHQEQEQNNWPAFRPGTRPEFRSRDIRRPSDQHRGNHPDRRPPENRQDSNNDRKPLPPQRPHSRDRRPHERRY
ncbi:MAG: hypothetical protein IJS39_15035 [Synergistaceae bacterium]|nr:hypothetical protein [Synergistaceae bacterium]